jgi:hypothetical protein
MAPVRQVSRAADLCQRNHAASPLWLRLIDALLLWQRRVDDNNKNARGGGGGGAGGGAGGIVARSRGDLGPISARSRRDLSARLRDLVRTVLTRAGEQMPLDAVLRHILDAHTHEPIGGFRVCIADVLDTWRHQRALLGAVSDHVDLGGLLNE